MLGVWIIAQLQAENDAKLDALPDDQLKALWDRAPDDGSHVVDGHDLDDVWRALNRRGLGSHCTI